MEPLNIEARYPSHKVQISITDNGPGIPEDVIDKIIIPFFSTKTAGSGIGLSLSRQIMLLHGGSLKVESVPGKFAVFRLEF
jgi:two-component system, NtrC family, nitrogen regulation sensor histidine kinase NtrY